ncbi:MAG: hypothetical protein SWH68_01850, partial [Thermodesulfobacteriota bacterium]|nr:hypothetical protein [Thermodesulfobacteriota bacterium]
MIGAGKNKPSLSRQCKMLNISRSSLYYRPKPVSSEDLKLMRLTLQRNLLSTKADNFPLSVRQVCPVISVLDPLNKPKSFFT